MSDIHALTAGAGDIIVEGAAGQILTNNAAYGINASAYGAASTGSIIVTTGANSTLNVGGAGIFAANSAIAIPVSASSTIAVTNKGTINMSGIDQNPVGADPGEGGSAPTPVPAGIMAGYNGGTTFTNSPSGPYSSCGVLGCTTLTPNPAVNGTVSVVNNGAINATNGYGIYAFNFGNGDISVTSSAPVTTTGATSQDGIFAFSAEVGNITVNTSANVSTDGWQRHPHRQRGTRDDDHQRTRGNRAGCDQRYHRAVERRRYRHHQCGNDPEPVGPARGCGYCAFGRRRALDQHCRRRRHWYRLHDRHRHQ